jgi:periplasmic protein TonB
VTSGLAAGRWGESARWYERRVGSTRLRGAIGVSAVVHALMLAAAVFWRGPQAPPAPPVYAVSLVAAPPGPRAIGVVDPTPPPTPSPAATPQPAPREEVTPPPARSETRPEAMKAPAPTKATPKPALRATPVPATAKTPTPPKTTPARSASTKPAATKPAAKPTAKPTTAARPDAKPGATGSTAPRAGGGPEGGRGTDVANVQIAGLQFPYRGYLDNIVRQVALRFTPPRGSVLTADVAFLIHRDGSVSNVRVVKRSGNFSFDVEARGAVESAGQARAFGPLPEGFREDVLPVTFSFDPSIIR